jgi:tol-pal system protein YbgF
MVVLLGVGLILANTTLAAARPGSLEWRVERLERLVESRNLVDLVLRLQELQEEIQRLRGQLEVQEHRLKRLERRQQDLLFEREGQPPAPDESAGTPPPSPQVPELPAAEAGPPVVPAELPPRPAEGEISDEKAQYEKALALLQERQYDQAAGALRDFLDRYPQSRYAPNVWYWLGEAHYVQRRLPEALEAFQKVPDQYADSPKVPDALFKIGTVLDDQGQRDRARNVLNDLIDRYPRSSAAYLAEKRLQEWGNAGGR